MPVASDTALPPAEVSSLATNGISTLTPQPSPPSSPTPQNAPDLTGETILLVHLCDRTGLFSAAHASAIQAVEDLVGTINVKGGIFGAMLDLQLADTEGTTGGAQSALARMIRQNGEGPLVLICAPQAEAAVREGLNEDEIPALTPGLFTQPGGYLFGLDASPKDHFSYFIQNLLDHWNLWRPDAAPDEIRVAIIAWPQDIAGDLANQAILEGLEDAQLEIVMQAELAAATAANVFDLIYQARDQNANVIYTNARGFGLAALLNALQDLGLRQRFVVAASALSFDAQVYEHLHDTSYAEGLLLTSTWAWWSETAIAGNVELAALQPEVEDRDWGYLQMAGAVSVARRALEEAILTGGFEELSPETVFAALEDMQDYPALGGLFVVDYSGNVRSLTELRMWQMGAKDWELFLTE